MSGVGIGGFAPGYRSDASFDPADERLVESLLFALEALHGEASTLDLARHLDLPMNRIEPVLERMRKANLVHYEVVPNSLLVWRRSRDGIERTSQVARRLARRR
jgi:hypothetical protein